MGSMVTGGRSRVDRGLCLGSGSIGRSRSPARWLDDSFRGYRSDDSQSDRDHVLHHCIVP